MGRAWRSPACRAKGSDGMLTPVDDFRHHPTSRRVFKATVDLPSFMEALDALRPFRYGAGRLPGRHANCQRIRLPLSQMAHDSRLRPRWRSDNPFGQHSAEPQSGRWGAPDKLGLWLSAFCLSHVWAHSWAYP